MYMIHKNLRTCSMAMTPDNQYMLILPTVATRSKKY